MHFNSVTSSVLALVAGLASQTDAYPFMASISRRGIPQTIPDGVFPPVMARDTRSLMLRSAGTVSISTVNIKEKTIVSMGDIINSVQKLQVSSQVSNTQANQEREGFYSVNHPDVTTVMKVVQKVDIVQISGHTTISKLMFLESEVTANAGQDQTNIVQVTSEVTKRVTIINGNNNNNNGGTGTGNVNTGTGALNTGTGNAGNAGTTKYTLGDQKPTWTSVVSDPAGSKTKVTATATASKTAKEGEKKTSAAEPKPTKAPAKKPAEKPVEKLVKKPAKKPAEKPKPETVTVTASCGSGPAFPTTGIVKA